jgi:beta-glucanase (GH16 family)
MNTSKTCKSRSSKLIFISLALLSLLVVLIRGHFPSWNVSPYPAGTITQPHKTPTAPKEQLLFDDEFSETSLDTQKWNIEDTYVNGYHNCCLGYGVQYFTPEALSFRQGSLRITTQAQDVNGHHYTSGAITTENKFSFTYGRVEIRARLPKTNGLWSALWLLPNDRSSRREGVAAFEIDMMEMLGKDPKTVYMTNHWVHQYNTRAFTESDFSQDYHVFSITWTSKSIIWYIDGIQRFASEQGIADQSMYLIINANIGGNWPGNPDEYTVLPQHMYIDYVRVYQLP